MSTSPVKILFQGDSITDAFRKREEVNPGFQLGNGYVFLVASRLGADYPDRPWTFLNRGVSGDCVRRMQARWQEDALSLQPDILSLLGGINDTIRFMNQEGEPVTSDEEFATIYRQLLSSLRAQNPAIRFLLMEPYVVEAGPVIPAWREHLASRQQLVREIAGEFEAAFIPLQSVFDEATKKAPAEYWAYDGVHATHAGFQLIADAWIQAARPLLLAR